MPPINPNTERLTALVAPDMKELVEKVASKNPEFYVNFRPSATAVVREAIAFFLASRVRDDGTLMDLIPDSAPATAATPEPQPAA